MSVEIHWRHEYVIVDGVSYRARAEGSVVRGGRLLPHHQTVQVLRRIAREDPEALNRIRRAFALSPAPHEQGLADNDPLFRLAGGRPGLSFPDVEKYARLLVVERPRAVLASKPVAFQAPVAQLPTLAELRATVSLAMLDEWGNPLRGSVSYQLTAADGARRAGSFDGSGEARESGVKPGPAELSLPDLAVDDWKVRSAPPDGWLRESVALQLRDASGEPIGGATVRVEFANGAVRTAALDASGSCRIEGAPSWPMQVTLPDFDPENYD